MSPRKAKAHPSRAKSAVDLFSEPYAGPEGVYHAMVDLRQAATREDPHSVCAAYLGMKTSRQVPGGNVLGLAGEAVGEATLLRWRIASLSKRGRPDPGEGLCPRRRRCLPEFPAFPASPPEATPCDESSPGDRPSCASVAGLLANAFSHCGCYMCRDGTVACDVCDGLGLEAQGATCLECRGTGFHPCSFCGGTRWVDEAVIPREFLDEVRARRRDKTLQDAVSLLKTIRMHQRRGLGLLDPRARRRLARRSICIQARARYLRSCDVRGGEEAEPALEIVAQRLDRFLDLLGARAVTSPRLREDWWR